MRKIARSLLDVLNGKTTTWQGWQGLLAKSTWRGLCSYRTSWKGQKRRPSKADKACWQKVLEEGFVCAGRVERAKNDDLTRLAFVPNMPTQPAVFRVIVFNFCGRFLLYFTPVLSSTHLLHNFLPRYFLPRCFLPRHFLSRHFFFTPLSFMLLSSTLSSMVFVYLQCRKYNSQCTFNPTPLNKMREERRNGR